MKRYFYINTKGEQKGTFTLEELRNEHIDRNTLVWTQGMEEWKRAYDVVDLQPIFDVSASAVQNHARETSTPAHQTQYQQTQTHDLPVMPKSWMVESILVTILPFILCGNILSLLGIAAIVNASKVETLYHQGLFTQAQEASANAARWTKITLWIAIGAIILAIVGIIIAVIFFGSLAGVGNALSV